MTTTQVAVMPSRNPRRASTARSARSLRPQQTAGHPAGALHDRRGRLPRAGTPDRRQWPIAALFLTAMTVGAANTLNCYLERDSDGRMLRTRGRPLPAGLRSEPNPGRYSLGMSLAVFAIPALTFILNLVDQISRPLRPGLVQLDLHAAQEADPPRRSWWARCPVAAAAAHGLDRGDGPPRPRGSLALSLHIRLAAAALPGHHPATSRTTMPASELCACCRTVRGEKIARLHLLA